MEIGNIIKKVRLELELSQTAFADKMHVSFSTVNRWENGHAVPNPLAMATLLELCKKSKLPRDLTDKLIVLNKK